MFPLREVTSLTCTFIVYGKQQLLFHFHKSASCFLGMAFYKHLVSFHIVQSDVHRNNDNHSINSRYTIQDTRYKIQDTRYEIQDTRFSISGTKPIVKTY